MAFEFCPTLENLYRTREAVGQSGKPFRLTSGLSTVNNLLTIRQILVEIRQSEPWKLVWLVGDPR